MHIDGHDSSRPSTTVVEVTRPINFRQIFRVFAEKWWLILFIATLAAVVAGYVAQKLPVKYQAKAVLQVQQEEQRLVGLDELSHQDLRPVDVLNTIVQNINNRNVMLRVATVNDLKSDSRFLPRSTNVVTDASAASALSGMVLAKLRPETRLIDITVTHPNAALAQKLANSVAEEFIRQNLDNRFGTTKAANERLYEEAAKLKIKLENSEKQIQAYKESNQTASMEERENITTERLKELSKKNTEARSDRLRWEADLNEIKKLEKNPDAILAMPSVLADPAVSDLRRKIVDQEAQVQTLSLRYKPKYPKMMQAQRQLDDLRQTLRALAATVPLSVQSSYDGALAREKATEDALREAQTEALALGKKSIPYNTLVREAQSDRAVYDSVLKRLKETDLSKGLETASIAVVELASLPTIPLSPPAFLLIGAAFFVAFFGCWGALYLIKLANTSIQTVDQAENILGLPVWAAIPATRSSRKKLPHVLAEEPDSVCSEGFRTLRAVTGLAGREEKKQIMLFTSSDPSEGKTFCSLNHAICQAQEGKLTLLIDLDLRRPSVGASFGFPSNTAGVTDYLVNKKPLAELVRATDYPNLYVLTAGAVISNPAEELTDDAVRPLLEEASQRFDRIIVDTAPINAVSDTFLILHLAQIICLVVRSGKTSRRVIARAVELMARAGVPPAGIVLNYLPKSSGHGRHYYYAPKSGYYTRNGSANGTARKELLNTR
jgi:capsular exopolysaccharide synthesis family protein